MNEIFLKKAAALKPRLHVKNVRANGEFTLAASESAVFDFGTHCTGYPKLRFSYQGAHPDAPALIKLRFCERAEELQEDTTAYHGWISRSWIQEEQFHLDILPCEYICKRRYAFRYIKVEVVDISRKFKLSVCNVEADAVSSVDEDIEPCGNETLVKNVDKVALKTLSECMQDVFEDGPKRDRRLWLGDLRLQALTNYCTYRRNDLVKRCLYLFAGTADESGRIAQSVFVSPSPAAEESSLYDYSLLFIPTLLDYLQATGDVHTAEELLPLAEKQVELAQEQFDGDVIRDCDRLGWCFLDWSLLLNKQAGAQAVYIYSEKALIELCKLLGKPCEKYADDIEAKTRGAIKAFFDEKRKLFTSGKEGQISYAANVWFILAKVFPQEKNLQIFDALHNCKDAIKPVTPYMMHHYVQALFDCGRDEAAKKAMLEYWGGMVRCGADTFWELYDPDDSVSPYGGKTVNSYCHAWSCTPSYFIRKYF